MKGFPKTIKAREDLYNCYQLVKEGSLEKEDLLAAIEAIETRNYIYCPVLAVDDTKKVFTIRYCAEAAAGQKIKNGETLYNVATVEHVEEDDGTGNITPVTTIITTTAKVASPAEKIGIPEPSSVYDELGVTEAEIETMKGGLA